LHGLIWGVMSTAKAVFEHTPPVQPVSDFLNIGEKRERIYISQFFELFCQ